MLTQWQQMFAVSAVFRLHSMSPLYPVVQSCVLGQMSSTEIVWGQG